MKDLRRKVAQLVSQEEIFRALNYATLKARAGRLTPGEIIRIGEFELVVAEDDVGESVAVQIIEKRSLFEDLAMAKARELGVAMESWEENERIEWMASFFIELRDNLRRWQNIETHQGPGENLTFEKAVYKQARYGSR